MFKEHSDDVLVCIQKMPNKQDTGRAIIHYPYRGRTREYNSILLSLEHNGRFSLPGGQFKQGTDATTLDTAIREVKEELGLELVRESGRKIYEFEGRRCHHEIYLVEAHGTVKLSSELDGIGFFNCGRNRQIPTERLERHVLALSQSYFGKAAEQETTQNRIVIPSTYTEAWDKLIKKLTR